MTGTFIAVGSILTQKGEDGNLHPVAYFSTALQESIRHWYVYLSGKHFILKSVYNPLTFLRKQKDPQGKFSRWITGLEEFDYTIQYIPGKENAKEDVLSRSPGAQNHQPESQFEDKIYSLDAENENFPV